MKKTIAILAVLLALVCIVSCGKEKKSEGVMTYAEFMEAPLNSEIVIETYVQGKQEYNATYSQTSLYTMDQDGGYFVYRYKCSQEEFDKLAVGTKIKVSGYKSEWAGEVEITDAKIEILKGSYKAKATDVTAFFGKDELINYENRLVAIKGAEVATKAIYNWDGSGQAGSNCDLYFDVLINGAKYNFTVESSLMAEGTAAYNAVLALNVGDKVDLEGFLYWYNGANTHITSAKVAK